MDIDVLLAEIKKETESDELKELIDCIGILSFTPEAIDLPPIIVPPPDLDS